MSTTINRKINHIFILLEKLANGLELYPQDERLQQEIFGEEDKPLKNSSKAHERSLRRYLEDIHQLYGHIVITEKRTKEFSDRKVTVYRVTKKEDISSILKFFLEQKSDLSWIVQMLHEQDPSLIHELENDTREAVENELKDDEEIFLFNSSPFEVFESPNMKKTFSNLKQAVKEHEYRDIQYKNFKNEELLYENAKCLKMIYTQNNWYIGIETNKEVFELLRIRFIKEVKYSKKVGYQKNVLLKYRNFFAYFQNAMSVINIAPQKAILSASPNIALYFEEDMKPFFKSQKFIEKLEDGSIKFSILFTKPLEILPFIKQWIPDISILEPQELKELLQKELSAMIQK